MSSTTRPSRNGERDAYYTPDAVARACIKVTRIPAGATVLEPSVGGGAFVRALAGRLVAALDIDPRAPGLALVGTAAQVADFERWTPGNSRPEWAVGNPPFNAAQPHVVKALSLATVGVGFLLRLAFLEGQLRAPFWRAHPAAEVHVLTARPSFTGGGTDSAAYGWFVWRAGHTGPTTLQHLDWRARG